MLVYVFQSTDHTVGITEDQAGLNLPTNHGAWELIKDIDITAGDDGHIGLNSEQALLDIGTNGYHLARVERR